MQQWLLLLLIISVFLIAGCTAQDQGAAFGTVRSLAADPLAKSLNQGKGLPRGGFCGDGNCSLDENVFSCPIDCNALLCGNGVLNPAEECEIGIACPNNGVCDLNSCSCITPVCGNNRVDLPNNTGQNEICDGLDLGNASCESLGFDGGTLGCNADCNRFDTDHCANILGGCGDGIANRGEQCGEPGLQCSPGTICNTDSCQCFMDANLQCAPGRSGTITREWWAPVVLDNPSGVNVQSFSAPNIANGDIVATRYGGELVVTDSWGNFLPGFPMQLLGSSDYLSMPTVGRWDANGPDRFVIVGYNTRTNNNQVWVFEKQGATYRILSQWVVPSAEPNSPTQYRNRPAPLTIADLFRDGDPEIIGFLGRDLHVWNAQGQEQTGFPVSYTGGNFTYASVAAADLDFDRTLEIVARQGDGNVSVIDRFGNRWWSRVVGESYESPIVGDIDRDGNQEIIMVNGVVNASDPNQITIFDVFGTIEQQWPTGFNNGLREKAVTLVPLTSAQVLDPIRGNPLSIVTRNRSLNGTDSVFAYSYFGALVPDWPLAVGNGSGDITALDICQDRKTELLALGDNQNNGRLKLIVLSDNGRQLQEIPLMVALPDGNFFAQETRSPPVLADIDRDGQIEIVFTWSLHTSGATTSYRHVIDAYQIGPRTSVMWPQFQRFYNLQGTAG